MVLDDIYIYTLAGFNQEAPKIGRAYVNDDFDHDHLG